MARELIILQRFKRDYRTARKHAEFDAETLEYIFDALISGERLPSALREHRLGKSQSFQLQSAAVVVRRFKLAIDETGSASIPREGEKGSLFSRPCTWTTGQATIARSRALV